MNASAGQTRWEEIEWVGQQHLLHEYCGRKLRVPPIETTPQQATVPEPGAYRRFLAAMPRVRGAHEARRRPRTTGDVQETVKGRVRGGVRERHGRSEPPGRWQEPRDAAPRVDRAAGPGLDVPGVRGPGMEAPGKDVPGNADPTALPAMEFGMAGIEIESSRFGRLVVDEERVMTFPNGLLGFPDHTRFALIQTGSENYFFWLQSIDDANLAFVVTDPSIFFKDYEVPVRDEMQQELQLTDPGFLQVFVICNKVGEWLTGNLLGPIVVNAENRLAQQVVLTEKKWTTRQPLLKLAAEAPPLAKSA